MHPNDIQEYLAQHVTNRKMLSALLKERNAKLDEIDQLKAEIADLEAQMVRLCFDLKPGTRIPVNDHLAETMLVQDVYLFHAWGRHPAFGARGPLIKKDGTPSKRDGHVAFPLDQVDDVKAKPRNY